MDRGTRVLKCQIDGNTVYKSIVSDGKDSAALDIDTIDERIGDKISVMFGNIQSFLEMIYVQATHEPESLSPASILEIGNRLIDTYEKKILRVIERLEAKVGEIKVVEARKGNGHIDEGKILDVLCEWKEGHE